MLKFVLLGTLLACGLASGPCQAASFDCQKAKTPVEHVICSDPGATNLNLALNTAYHAAMEQLSPEGQAELRRSEFSFLNALAIQCQPPEVTPATSNSTSKPSEEIGRCVERALQDRADLLVTSVGAVGGHRFFTVSTYRARIVQIDKGDGTTTPFVVTEEVDIVQIDAPQSDAEVTWNAVAREQAAAAQSDVYKYTDDSGAHNFKTNDDRRVWVTMSLVSASPDLVSTVVGEDTYRFEAAHPQEWANSAATWSLRLGRPLGANDIFDETKPWGKALQPMVEAHLKAASPPLGSAKPYDVDRVNRWQLRADGLAVVYRSYELGGYTSEAAALIPWSELKPYLRQDLPFDPKDIQSIGAVIY